jgi:hypothetical protein
MALPALAMSLALASCGPSGPSPADATAEVLGQILSLTATAAAANGVGPEGGQLTAEAIATAKSEAAAATEAVQSALSAGAEAATATAEAPFKGDLPLYGVDPAQGQFGWIHPPLEIYVDGYHQYDFDNRFFGTVAGDFAVSSDITWNTKYGTAGCGFVLRSDGDEEAPNQYLVVATRFGDGRVIFNVMLDGEFFDARDIYAFGRDPEFDWHNDTTNRLTVVGRGSVFSIFTNGTEIGKIDVSKPPPPPPLPPEPKKPDKDADPEVVAEYEQAKKEYDETVSRINTEYARRVKVYEDGGTQFERGFIAMVALNESGYTDCNFNDTWLWLMQ